MNEENQFYHCFGCHEHGDVIKFVQKMENLPFYDAVKMLAQSVGMQMPETDGANKDSIEQERKKKARLLGLLKEVAIYYNNNLKNSNAKLALDYMKNRGISTNIATRFGLGCSLGFQDVIDFLKKKGYTEEEMFEAGVVKMRDAGSKYFSENTKYYDAVGGRLVFPIINVYGEVVAFCGRVLEKDAKFAKYINTAETKIFSKGKNLYGINLLKRKNTNFELKNIIVVEGQMDVVSLHSAGFVQAVASMGTALTQDQAKLLKRFVDTVYICYDGDSAGKKATLRGLDILKEQNLTVFVMSLPEGMDPDDVIKKQGKQAFEKLMEQALPLNEFKLAYLKRVHDINTKEGKAKYIEAAIEILKELSEVEREVYVEYVAEATNTNKDFLKRQLNKDMLEEKEVKKESVVENKIFVDKSINNAIIKAKRFVLASLAHRKPYAVLNQQYIKYFDEQNFKQLYEFMLSKKDNAIFNVIDLYNMFPNNNEVGEIINFVFDNIGEASLNKYYYDCLKMIENEYLKERKTILTKKLKEEPDGEQRKKILIELGEIAKNLKKGGNND